MIIYWSSLALIDADGTHLHLQLPLADRVVLSPPTAFYPSQASIQLPGPFAAAHQIQLESSRIWKNHVPTLGSFIVVAVKVEDRAPKQCSPSHATSFSIIGPSPVV